MIHVTVLILLKGVPFPRSLQLAFDIG
ncbi:hypothetical protein Gogos_000923 [Gossypium gossypioides]|uniref:Uncharacterized protein n=1 Tax=Gossypium gossypioides TaxID=34282 RepID=A0A7J9CUI6_GOSGO|nr:hypothetical protein [Gossypium gossypioides]